MGYYSAHRTTPGRGGRVIPVVVVVVVTVVVVVVDVRVVFASAICVACESIASKIKARAATPAETMGASAILPVVLVLFAASMPKCCRCHQLGCQKINKDKEGCGSVSGCPEEPEKSKRVIKSTFKQLVCTLCSYHFTGEEELATSNDPSPYSDVTHAYCHYYCKVIVQIVWNGEFFELTRMK